MNIHTLNDLYLTELQEARSIETQLADALPRMIDAAQDDKLKQAIDDHLIETRGHLTRIESLLKSHDVEMRKHRDQTMEMLISEAERWVAMMDDPAIRDAALIATMQRIEHYEIAVYGTLASWAKLLGYTDDVRALIEILYEEKAADSRLTEFAKQEANPEAVA